MARSTIRILRSCSMFFVRTDSDSIVLFVKDNARDRSSLLSADCLFLILVAIDGRYSDGVNESGALDNLNGVDGQSPKGKFFGEPGLGDGQPREEREDYKSSFRQKNNTGRKYSAVSHRCLIILRTSASFNVTASIPRYPSG